MSGVDGSFHEAEVFACHTPCLHTIEGEDGDILGVFTLAGVAGAVPMHASFFGGGGLDARETTLRDRFDKLGARVFLPCSWWGRARSRWAWVYRLRGP